MSVNLNAGLSIDTFRYALVFLVHGRRCDSVAAKLRSPESISSPIPRLVMLAINPSTIGAWVYRILRAIPESSFCHVGHSL